MHLRLFFAILLSVLPSIAQSGFPSRFEWQRRNPDAVGLDSGKVNEAIAYHRSHESKAPRDLRRAHDLTFAREAYGEPLGPLQTRGEPTGIIVRHGIIVAEWGEPQRVDMTHSVTKSFLSTVVGVAF